MPPPPIQPLHALPVAIVPPAVHEILVLWGVGGGALRKRNPLGDPVLLLVGLALEHPFLPPLSPLIWEVPGQVLVWLQQNRVPNVWFFGVTFPTVSLGLPNQRMREGTLCFLVGGTALQRFGDRWVWQQSEGQVLSFLLICTGEITSSLWKEPQSTNTHLKGLASWFSTLSRCWLFRRLTESFDSWFPSPVNWFLGRGEPALLLLVICPYLVYANCLLSFFLKGYSNPPLCLSLLETLTGCNGTFKIRQGSR